MKRNKSVQRSVSYLASILLEVFSRDTCISPPTTGEIILKEGFDTTEIYRKQSSSNLSTFNKLMIMVWMPINLSTFPKWKCYYLNFLISTSCLYHVYHIIFLSSLFSESTASYNDF